MGANPLDGKLAVYLEVTSDDQWSAHVLDLPGCVVFAHDREAALDALRYDVIGYFEWLEGHGDTVPPRGASIELVVAETVTDVSRTRGTNEQVAVFSPELEPATKEQIERAITLLTWCQDDLRDLVPYHEPRMLRWQAGIGSRSISEILEHTTLTELWMLSRLHEEPGDLADVYETFPLEDPIDSLGTSLDHAAAEFRAWDERQRGERFVPQDLSRYGAEVWTARKVLRRFVEHRREHLAEIRRIVETTSPW